MKGGKIIDKRKLKAKVLIGLLAVLAVFLTAAAAQAQTVYAGGQSIGVLLETDGLTVVGVSPVVTDQGERLTPAADAGLMIGDLIVSVDGVQVQGDGDITELLAAAGTEGRECRIEYQRQGESRIACVEPVYCGSSDSWRIGLYMREDAAGVGTLTFWDPQSGTFGALGHSVTGVSGSDAEEGRGIVVRAVIQDLQAGEPGAPGEKLGVLQEGDWQGRIDADRVCGIFGQMDSLPAPGGELMETAAADEVEEGPAQMLTVIEGEEVESFDVNVLRTGNALDMNGGMIVEVTDQRLLEAAGGIIQGMSGSPLIQNGRLIGAVSHVFVNDPGKGYAVYIDDMLAAAGLTEDSQAALAG